MKYIYLAVCLTLSSLVVQGCATTYGPNGASGGYEEIRINSSSYRVLFEGNQYLGVAGCERFFLRRAAELMKEAGYKRFVVRDFVTNASTSNIKIETGIPAAPEHRLVQVNKLSPTTYQVRSTKVGGGAPAPTNMNVTWYKLSGTAVGIEGDAPVGPELSYEVEALLKE